MPYRSHTLLIVLPLGPVVLLTAYVLSVGPAARLLQSHLTGQRGEEFLHCLYWPLTVVCRHSPWLEHWTDWYINFWLPSSP